MGPFLSDIETTIKTSRSKTEVISSLEEIASFKDDNFKFPVRIFGNKLFVKRKLVVGKGLVTNDKGNTYVRLTLSASGQLKTLMVTCILIFLLMFISALLGVIGGNLEFLPFLGLVSISVIALVFPRIVYLFAVQLKKDSIENLVLHGN